MTCATPSIPQRQRIAPLIIACGLCSAECLAIEDTTALDPKRTFIHTSANDASLSAVAIELASFGIAAGDRIQIQRLGDFDNGPLGDEFTTMFGVFSSNATLLPASNFHRVPGAIAAGVAFVSAPTFFGGEATDIPEDFAVSHADYPSGSICIVVPAGATHLFLTPHDTFYEDNNDPDGDFGFDLSLLDSCAADLDHDGMVGGADLGTLLGNWGTHTVIGVPGDLNCDGIVDGADLGQMLGFWGSC